VTPEERVALEHERDFLLRSLDDLDDERTAGNIDDGTYAELHADYTARASAAIQQLAGADAGVVLVDDVPQTSLTRRLTTMGAVIAFCVLIAFLLAHAVGQRAPGQTITGNKQAAPNAGGTSDVGAALKAAADAAPTNYNARIQYARYLLSGQDFPNAIVQYTTAAGIDPKQPEPYAYRGWLTSLVAGQVTDLKSRDLLVSRATTDLDHAIALDKSYPDAYVFKGLLYLNVENKPAQAVPLFQQFLVYAPADHPMRSQVETALQQATVAAKSAKP